jgi:hypothetical protein
MAAIENVWDEPDFKSSKKMLVLLPSKVKERGAQKALSPGECMKSCSNE